MHEKNINDATDAWAPPPPPPLHQFISDPILPPTLPGKVEGLYFFFTPRSATQPAQFPFPLHAVAHARARLGVLLGGPLGLLLQLGHALVGVAVRLDGLLAVGRELGLPVAGALPLLVEGVVLVLLVVGIRLCLGNGQLSDIFPP